jgi:hypothetical protein
MSVTGAGGRLTFVYGHPSGEQHTVHMHVAQFDPAPITTSYGTNDRAYLATGPVVPTETSILQTWQALAALWAPYYGPHWWLRLAEVKQIVDSAYVYLSDQPEPAEVLGTNSSDVDSGPRVNRKFRLLTPSGMVRYLT